MPDVYGKDDEIEISFVEDVYYPTRLEYFAARALQALLTSVSEKKHDTAAVQAVVIASQIEIVLDKAQG